MKPRYCPKCGDSYRFTKPPTEWVHWFCQCGARLTWAIIRTETSKVEKLA